MGYRIADIVSVCMCAHQLVNLSLSESRYFWYIGRYIGRYFWDRPLYRPLFLRSAAISAAISEIGRYIGRYFWDRPLYRPLFLISAAISAAIYFLLISAAISAAISDTGHCFWYTTHPPSLPDILAKVVLQRRPSCPMESESKVGWWWAGCVSVYWFGDSSLCKQIWKSQFHEHWIMR